MSFSKSILAVGLLACAVPLAAGRLADFKEEARQDQKSQPSTDGSGSSSSSSSGSSSGYAGGESGDSMVCSACGATYYPRYMTHADCRGTGYQPALGYGWQHPERVIEFGSAFFPLRPYADDQPWTWWVNDEEARALRTNASLAPTFAARRSWYLAGGVEWRRFDASRLSDIVVQLEYTSLSALKLKLDVDTFIEKLDDGTTDTLNWTRVLACWSIGSGGFALDLGIGPQMLGDIDKTLLSLHAGIRVLPGKPWFFEASFSRGISTKSWNALVDQATVRVGRYVDFAGLQEVGLSMNWLRLGSTGWTDGLGVYVRFWM